MKIKIAFAVAGIGTLLASILRCIQMMFYFNYETGFITDSGVFTYLYCGIVLLSSLVCGILCRMDRSVCGTVQRGRSWGIGTTALIVALFLFFTAVVLLMDTYNYAHFRVSYSVEPMHIIPHVPLAVLSALFGIAAMITAISWLRGGRLPGSLGAVWAVGIVWGLYYMVLTFMTYSASATTQENLFTVGGGALMLLFLLAEGKMLSGTGGRKAARAVFMFGLPAAIFWLTYVLSNTALIIFGRGYVTEMPYIIQLVMLALSIHDLVLLGCLRSKELFVPSAPSNERSERSDEE